MSLPAARFRRGSALAFSAILFGLGGTEVRGDLGESSDELAARLAELRRSGDCASVRRELDARFGSDFQLIPLEVVLGAGECVVEPDGAVRFAESLLARIDRRTDPTACRARFLAARLAEKGGDEAVAERSWDEILEWCPEDDFVTRQARTLKHVRELQHRWRGNIGNTLVLLIPALDERPLLLSLLSGWIAQFAWFTGGFALAALVLFFARRRSRTVAPRRRPGLSRMLAWTFGAWFVGVAPLIAVVGWTESPGFQVVPASDDWNLWRLVAHMSEVLQYAILLIAVLREGDFRRLTRKPGIGWWKVGLAAAGGFAAKVVAVRTLGGLSESSIAFRLGEWGLHPTDSPTGFGLVLFLVFAVLPQAAIEEWFFRGWIQGRLQVAVPRVAAVVITACLFAVTHSPPSPYALIPLFASGIIYGCLVVVTRSLWTSVLTHVAWNVLVLLSRARL